MGYRFFAQVHYSVSQRVEFVLLLMNIQRTRTNSPSNAGAGAARQTDSCSCQGAVLHVQGLCVLLAHILGKWHERNDITPLIKWVAHAQKVKERKQTPLLWRKTALHASPPPLVHFKCVSAIGGHNSERRGKKNSGATLGGNLAN